MSDVATYISWAQYHGIELDIEVTEEQFTWCKASADQFLYEWFDASDMFWKLASNQLLKLLDEIISISAFGADPSDSQFEMVNEYLYSDTSTFTAPEFPYFMLLLGH